MAYQPHEQRVIAERDELADRIIKLEQFIDKGAIFGSLPSIEQKALWMQLTYMRDYCAVLIDRCSRFVG